MSFMNIIKVDEASSEAYLSGIAEVHYGAYSKEHFTSCFNQDLLKKYYRVLIKSSDLSVVAVEGGVVVGFVVSGYSVGRGVSQFIKDNRASVIKVFIRNPRFICEKAIAILTARLGRARASAPISPFRLMSISVRSGTQSRGVGSALLSFFEKNLLASSVFEYGLSVRKKNKRAVEFYIRNGFSVQKETRDSLYFYKELKHG